MKKLILSIMAWTRKKLNIDRDLTPETSTAPYYDPFADPEVESKPKPDPDVPAPEPKPKTKPKPKPKPKTKPKPKPKPKPDPDLLLPRLPDPDVPGLVVPDPGPDIPGPDDQELDWRLKPYRTFSEIEAEKKAEKKPEPEPELIDPDLAESAIRAMPPGVNSIKHYLNSVGWMDHEICYADWVGVNRQVYAIAGGVRIPQGSKFFLCFMVKPDVKK